MPSPFTSFQDTFGAMLIGTFVMMVVYGITSLQAYFYYMSFPKDGRGTKLLVGSIWMLDTIHAGLVGHCVHYYLIAGFLDHSLLVNGIWSLFTSLALNLLEAFIVQAFFTHRIFLLCSPQRRWWVAGIIAFFVLAHFVFGIKTVVNLFNTKEFSRLKDVSFSSVVPFGVSTTLSDILIAVALCVLLHSNRSEFGDTNTIINKLIIYAINRCILTSAVAITETIVFALLPNTFYSFAMDFIIGKLYANSLLAVLNSRATLRAATRDEFSSTEMSTRFNVNSPVPNHQTSILAAPNHQTSLYQVRTHESDGACLASGSEKGESHQMIRKSVAPEKHEIALGSGV